MPHRHPLDPARRQLLAATALAAAGWPLAARAQATAPWPSKSITWVVPFTPGGVTDTTSRAIAKRLGELIGAQIVIENKPGAGGSTGTEAVARAAPDGYTLLYATSGTMAANLALYKNLKYDPLKDFVPVHGMLLSPTVLVVDAAKPFKSVAELVAFGKANPGKLNYASAGNGTGTHLTGELFQDEAGIQMQHVPYKGSAPALQDLLGGRVDMMFDYTVTLLPHIKSGKLRPLAVMGNKRMEVLPDTPTIHEAGFPEAASSSWSGIVVPAGTPADIVRKLANGLNAVMKDQSVISQFTSLGSVALVDMGEGAFKSFIQAEQKKWAEVVRKSGATLS